MKMSKNTSSGKTSEEDERAEDNSPLEAKVAQEASTGVPEEEEKATTDEDSSGDSVVDSDFNEEDDDFIDSGASESGEFSGDEDASEHEVGNVPTMENGHGGDFDSSDSEESEHAADESDSSEDEVPPRNTVGDVPLEFYKDEEHIGYDLTGKKITKKQREDILNAFLAKADNPENWRKVYDEYNDEMVEPTEEELKMVLRVIKGKAPHADFDPYPTAIDWLSIDKLQHPFPEANEPKRRFIPSSWESKKVAHLVRLIRKGSIKIDEEPKEDKKVYLLWGDDANSTDRHHIPAPKPKLPGHEESYNPSVEYIPTEDELNSYQDMFKEDRPKFIPKQFTSLRSVPAYDKAVRDAFDRCLDLYLCPRVRKKRINIDPESLKPKLPSRKDLKPYPQTCYLEYKGHKGPVLSISIDPRGQWMASGSADGTTRIWDVQTGRCLRIWDLGEAVQCVAWNPSKELPILAVAAGPDVFLLNPGHANELLQKTVDDLIHIGPPTAQDDSENHKATVSWSQDDKLGGIRLHHFKTVSSVEWHRKGDYFSTLVPLGESRAVSIHQLSKRVTQKVPFKLHGLPVSIVFHPSRSIFFISTKKNVRVYDLVNQKLMKKLETRVREISSIAVHPLGDNVIVGSKDGKLCWFDMDLSSQPYRVLKPHKKDINKVAFHSTYPLFATSSDDGTAYVFHGMVYSDLNQNPLLVPLEILRGHLFTNGRGVLDCKFHPTAPWLFTAGADSVIKLYTQL